MTVRDVVIARLEDAWGEMMDTGFEIWQDMNAGVFEGDDAEVEDFLTRLSLDSNSLWDVRTWLCDQRDQEDS